MTGPELKFVWLIKSPPKPLTFDSNSTSDGCSSISSSVSKDTSSANYEEIDDVLKVSKMLLT